MMIEMKKKDWEKSGGKNYIRITQTTVQLIKKEDVLRLPLIINSQN